MDSLRANAGITDVTTLFAGLRRQVLLKAEQTPQYGDVRLAGHDGGDFIFARAGAQVAAVPRPEPRPPSFKEEIVKQFGSLAISAFVPGVEVFLSDQRVGEVGPGRRLTSGDLEVGAYRVRARKAGYKDWEREVRIAANQRAELVIDIEPLRPEPPKAPRTEDGAEMVLVPAGEFLMGSNDGAYDEKPPHRVYLDAFSIDKYETTNALYKRFMDATGRPAPSYWSDGNFNGASQPVVGVSWGDADAYCRWAGKRLPTEAEWEKVARGTDGRKYPWGEQWDATRANAENRLGKTVPVGSHASGASPYGAQDMAGNAWEWVADWYGSTYYRNSPERNPEGPDSGTSRVLRGGSWLNYPRSLRSAFRLYFTPDFRSHYLGFRCARGAS
jgi:formylglycine-generating enzyme required for sulfatase activity